MNCEDVREQLSEFVDGTLSRDRYASIDAHLSSCAACATLARDLDRIRMAAGQLGPIEPPGHVWLEIAGRMQLDGHGTLPAPTMARGRRQVVWQWAGLAAALVLITVGLYVARHVGVPPQGSNATTTSAGNPPAPGTVEAFQDELRQAEAHYEKAIAALEAITKNNDGSMDPAVAAAVQKNLLTIDRAIADSKAALNANPDSEAARESLFEAFRRKVGVLQATVALMNEMRKGNQQGVASVAPGLGRS